MEGKGFERSGWLGLQRIAMKERRASSDGARTASNSTVELSASTDKAAVWMVDQEKILACQAHKATGKCD